MSAKLSISCPEGAFRVADEQGLLLLDLKDLRALLQHLRHTLGRPPAEVATRLAQLRQFLKLDDPLEEAHVCQHAG